MSSPATATVTLTLDTFRCLIDNGHAAALVIVLDGTEGMALSDTFALAAHAVRAHSETCALEMLAWAEERAGRREVLPGAPAVTPPPVVSMPTAAAVVPAVAAAAAPTAPTTPLTAGDSPAGDGRAKRRRDATSAAEPAPCLAYLVSFYEKAADHEAGISVDALHKAFLNHVLSKGERAQCTVDDVIRQAGVAFRLATHAGTTTLPLRRRAV